MDGDAKKKAYAGADGRGARPSREAPRRRADGQRRGVGRPAALAHFFLRFAAPPAGAAFLWVLRTAFLSTAFLLTGMRLYRFASA